MSYPHLHQGDHGHEVELLQRALQGLRYEIRSVDGVFGPLTALALEEYQKDKGIAGLEQGCGDVTWGALAGEYGNLENLGTAGGAHEYLNDAYGIWADGMSDTEKLHALEYALNNKLADDGVPYVRFVFDSTATPPAEFDHTAWRLHIEQTPYQGRSLTADEQADYAGQVYHECRHAQQWWDVARVLAGAHGLDAAAIQDQSGIQADVATHAVAHPTQDAPSGEGPAIDWYSGAYGGHAPAGHDGAAHATAAGHGTLPTLHSGSHDPEHVRYLQSLLAWRHYAVTADGVFGHETQQAVAEFQAANGLTADGVVGPATWHALVP
jgi:peptidoglycan hydrolase-like protein with peptidoglycan-binding domain